MTKLFQSATNKSQSFVRRTWLITILLGVLCTCLFLYPVIRHATTHLPSYDDGIFIAWTIQWIGHALRTGGYIFDAPIFYPYQNTLTFSDPFLTSGIINMVISFFTTNIVLQNTVHIILGSVLCFYAMFLLSHYLTKNIVGAYIAAVFFTFSSLRLHYLVHLHTFLVAGIPLTIYCYLRWVNDKKMYWLPLSSCFFLAQTLNSPMTGFFSMASILPFVLQQKSLRVLSENKILTTSIAIVTFCILGIFYLPYFQTSMEFAYTRSIRDTAHFAHSLNRFISWELAVVYLLLFLGRKKLNKSALVVTAIGAMLMLGPVIKINDQTVKLFGYPIPLPYAFFYYVIPGFKAFRASSRWITVFNLGLSLSLGYAVTSYQLRSKTKIVLAGAITCLLWITQIPQLQLHAVPLTIPSIYNSTETASGDSLAEFPVYVWSMHPYVSRENERLLYQLTHRKKLYNGVSGFTPPEREQRWATISQQFPTTKVLTHLKQSGVQLIIVHFSEYDQLHTANYEAGNMTYPNAIALKQLIGAQPQLRELRCDNMSCLYRIEE